MPDRSSREQNAPEQSSRKRHAQDPLEAGHEPFHSAGENGDLLGMQRTVGNQSVARMIALGGREARSRIIGSGATALLSRKPDPMIQRANFAELMQFWKQQELGQAPAPKPQGKREANNAPPEPAPIPQNVAVDNPALVEEPPGGAKSPVGGGGGSVFDQPSPLVTGGAKGSGTQFDSLPSGMKGSGAGGGALLTMSGPGSGGALVTKSGSGSGGWSSSVDSGGGPVVAPGQIRGNKTAVKYLDTAEAREEFELKVGGSVTQGGKPYDTSAMYSKFKGDGFAIYVMGKDGRFYSTSHKIGLFHHSSFLGGGDVAGAGEIKVVGGTVQYITNKSGHYWPGDVELAQTLHALQGASGFGTAALARLKPNGGFEDPYPDGAPGFLRDHPLPGTGGGSNKDAVKYNTKSMNSSHKGEEDDSLHLVREIITAFVGAAQQGKLKKFNKPNPDFGKTFEDIKTLVLGEFGWSEADVVTYQAVLENWNNTRPIGPVSGSAPPMPSASPPTASPTFSSRWSSQLSSGGGTFSGPVGGSGTPAASGGLNADGRDYDAELEELLKNNPSPDWGALGLQMYSGAWQIVRGMFSMYPSAKQKVQLLKGEKTIDELD
jgi:hypothetical protein